MYLVTPHHILPHVQCEFYTLTSPCLYCEGLSRTSVLALARRWSSPCLYCEGLGRISGLSLARRWLELLLNLFVDLREAYSHPDFNTSRAGLSRGFKRSRYPGVWQQTHRHEEHVPGVFVELKRLFTCSSLASCCSSTQPFCSSAHTHQPGDKHTQGAKQPLFVG